MAVFSQLSEQERAELWACLALRHCRGVGASRSGRLIAAYGSPYEAVQVGLQHARAWLEQGVASAIACSEFFSQKWRGQALAEWQQIQQTEAHILCRGMDAFPALLQEVPDAPLVLYAKGDISLLGNPAISVVGARQCTREGVAVSAFFARDLSRAGVTVISGMAKGIDRAAHLAGLEGCGKSIAVLGTGIDIMYPACNNDLAAALWAEGLLISEFPPDTPAIPKNFPIRNRIISGLARGVLVVEAAGRSGSLITARLALEQGREVFAVPGHTTATVSAGCRELIRKGAKAVFNADDILSELAPLLTLDAQQALVLRQKESGKVKPTARHAQKEPFTEELHTAQAVLPEGDIPWEAPAVPSGKALGKHKGTAKAVRPLQATGEAEKTGFGTDDAGALAGKPLPVAVPVQASAISLSAEEELVVGALQEETHIDVLSRTLGMDVGLLSRLLTVLEIRGVVQRKPGMYYSRT